MTKSILVVTGAFCVALSGCTPALHAPTALPNPAVTVNLIEPHPGQVFAVNQAIYLSASASSPRGISGLAFLTNSTVIERPWLGVPVEAPNSLSGVWIARSAGEYYIQARATLADGTIAISEPHRICVMDFGAGEWIGGRPGYTGEYAGPCPIPTPIATPNPDGASSGNLALHVVVSPTVLQFGGDLCPLASVTWVATVDDPQDLVALVHVWIRHAVVSVGGAGDTMDAWLNWITTRAGNQKEYRKTLQLTPAFGIGADAGTSEIDWGLDVVGRDGQSVASAHDFLRSRPIDCSPQRLQTGPSATPQVLEIFPSETPKPQTAPLGLPAFTFSKNAFCRKGPDTSFPDVTAIVAGDTVDILNVSEDGFWYYVFWKQFNAKCWVAKGTGVATGDVSGLKVLVGPELPQPGVAPAGKKPSPAPAPCNPLIKVCP